MLNKIIAECMLALDVSETIAQKLVTCIDILKLRGYTGGEAASKFADYLGFLRLSDNSVSQTFFAHRWVDHKVWIPITADLKQYLHSDTPLFTQSRLEPVFRSEPFYHAGLTKVDPGVNSNPEDHGTVRQAKPLPEAYQNFIIHEYLPNHFYYEVHNSMVEKILSGGLFEVDDDENPYKIYITDVEARTNLTKDLITSGKRSDRTDLLDYTLLRLKVSKMQMDNRVFYTKTISGHKGQSSAYGYFYKGAVPASGCSIAPTNISK